MSQPKRSTVLEPSEALRALLAKIANREARIGIIGQGYVGLPLAVVMAEAGFDVTGYDVAEEKVAQLNEGTSYIGDIDNSRLSAQLGAGLYRARSTFEDLGERDVISICVPTPLSKTRDPDISYIVQASEDVARSLRPGQLIVLESTTYPGTTEELVLPIFEKTGLKVGIDYFLCFSPERVDPGNPRFDIRNTPRLMGGITSNCINAGASMYGSFLEQVVQMSSTQAAEMAKLLENTFRAVNIGLVNEVALMCKKLGLESWEVIDAAATKPFGFMKFYPGPGLGGHCIPVDPHYLSWILKTLNYTARFVELASEVNTSMPTYVTELVTEALNAHKKPVNGSKVVVLGIAYKANVSDVRESPALDVIELLREKGAEVVYHDPYVPDVRLGHGTQTSEALTDDLLSSADCVVITAKHSSIDWRRVAALAPAIVDTRNATQGIEAPKASIYKL
ncbi:MAG: nucleotide sugar dehydrogenase [Deltaproteobacteria bacterium]|nr:nucleotide sugar dehydrogenase [Deltaproteobacteria bacterium]